MMHTDGYLCIGGPLDGKRVRIPNVSTQLLTALDVDSTYLMKRLVRRSEDHTTNPPTVFISVARILICDDSAFPDADSCVNRLSAGDWYEVEGSRRIIIFEKENP